MNPGIRDPRLNTAECVIQGHKPDITATGRSLYIRAMIWCSVIFVLPAGPYLAFVVWDVLKKNRADELQVSLFCWCNRQNPLASSVICLCFILFFVESGILLFVVVCSVSRNAPFDICIILGILIFEILRVVSVCCFKSPSCCTCGSLVNALIKIIANLTVYHFCWLVIGIMINPIWGLAVLLIVSFYCVVLAYALYKIFEAVKYCEFKQFVAWIVSIFGVCSLVVSAVLAGQSF